MAMNISKEGVAITDRFFRAIDTLIKAGQLRGLKSFTDTHNINRWNLVHVKDNPNNSVLKPELLALLVRHHNVSATWLLTGTGPMFQTETRQEDESKG